MFSFALEGQITSVFFFVARHLVGVFDPMENVVRHTSFFRIVKILVLWIFLQSLF